MPASMTGFGVGQAENAGVQARVELRSVNHRNLDPRFRMPSSLGALQAPWTERLRESLGRGHIEVSVDVQRRADLPPEIRVDHALAGAWHRALSDLAGALALEPTVPLTTLIAQPGVVTVQRPEEDAEASAAAAGAAFEAALQGLMQTRAEEGARLVEDLLARVDAIDALRGEVEALAGEALPAARERLRSRVADALDGATLDPARLEAEIVLIADRSDVTEEVVRLGGHLLACRAALVEETPGRKLGFLVQELLREVNTIGSKAGALAITERVVAAKVEIEKVREQVLNLA
ncbi:MAG: YicC family protein [Deltaproteobacteria bacterium]|nr:YicC family protein [Deltaproteobacteria bacterium]